MTICCQLLASFHNLIVSFSFGEAEKCKTRAAVLEAREAVRWLDEQATESAAATEQWGRVKGNELMVLQARLGATRDGLERQMRNEIDSLQCRFRSVEAELVSQHSLERAELSKVIQTQLALAPFSSTSSIEV